MTADEGLGRSRPRWLVGDLFCERRLEAAVNVDCSQLLVLALVVRSKLRAFEREVGVLGVLLRMHRHILARSHRHCAGDEGRESGDKDIAAAAVRGSNAHHQTGGREQTVVRSEHRRAQPFGAPRAVSFVWLITFLLASHWTSRKSHKEPRTCLTSLRKLFVVLELYGSCHSCSVTRNH